MPAAQNRTHGYPGAVEIRAIEGHQRGIAVVRSDSNAVSLHMYWPVGKDQGAFNDWSPQYGHLCRSVAYLTPTERRELAAELLKGL